MANLAKHQVEVVWLDHSRFARIERRWWDSNNRYSYSIQFYRRKGSPARKELCNSFAEARSRVITSMAMPHSRDIVVHFYRYFEK